MKLKPIEDSALLDHLDSIGRDGLDRFLLARGRYRLAALNGTALVNQMRANHNLGILETLILGHAYLAAALLASGLKGAERTTIDIQCDGPVSGLHVEGSATGSVRGYLFEPQIPIEAPVDSFDTAPWFGQGTLSVTRLVEQGRSPYTGRIELQHGNLAEDLTHYFAISEQIPTALALSVKFDRTGNVIGAGGILVQALPESGGNEELPVEYEQEQVAAELEALMTHLPSFGELLAHGTTPTELIRDHFMALDPSFIGTRPVTFFCDCDRERFRRFIVALPKDDLDEVRENGPFPLRITCHNCASDYYFEREELAAASSQ